MTLKKIISDIGTGTLVGVVIGLQGQLLLKKEDALINGAIYGTIAGAIYAGTNYYRSRKDNSIEEIPVWPIPRTKQEWDDEK